MKIAVFHNLPRGGAKRALYEHARHLRARGHMLDVFTTSAAAEADFLPLKAWCEHVISYPAPITSARALPWLGRKTLFQRAIRSSLEAQQALREMNEWERLYTQMAADIDKNSYDVAYVHNCRFLQSPHLLRALRSTPSVYYCQDTLRYVHEWSLSTQANYDAPGRPPLGRGRIQGNLLPQATCRLWQEQEWRDGANARAATEVLVNSFYSREAMLRCYGITPRVCYLGVDSDFFQPDPFVTREPDLVLSVGSIAAPKRHDFLLRAVAAIPPPRRPKVWIIGHGASSSAVVSVTSLQGLAETLEVDLRITCEVDDAVLRNAYQRASVVALGPHLEPFGFVPLEAMACATPVVSIREAGLRETIEHNATGLLTERDEGEFGAAIDALLCDPARARQMAARGRTVAQERWTWNASVDTLENAFSRVASLKKACS